MLELGHETLERRRIEGVEFDAAVVTDLGGPPALAPDAVFARRATAARLIRQVVPGGAVVIDVDDPQVELLGVLNLDARRVTFGLTRPSDVSARIVRLDRSGTRFRLRGFDREAMVTLRLPGADPASRPRRGSRGLGGAGVERDAVVAGLEAVAAVPGRLEPIDEGQSFDVHIDGTGRGPSSRRCSRPSARSRRHPAACTACSGPRARAPTDVPSVAAWPRPSRPWPTA